MKDHLYLAGDLLVILSATLLLSFIVLYHLKARWAKTTAGRHMMSFSIALELVLLLGVAPVTFGTDYPGRPLARVFVYGLLAVAIFYRIRLLYASQREHREQIKQESEVKEFHD